MEYKPLSVKKDGKPIVNPRKMFSTKKYIQHTSSLKSINDGWGKGMPLSTQTLYSKDKPNNKYF